jgi:hypothetical protein
VRSIRALTYLSWLAIFDRDHERAVALLEEGMSLCREVEDGEGIGRTLFSLGHLALDRGEPADARARFAQDLAIFTELNYQYGLAYALEGLADVAVAECQPGRGLRVAGAAAVLREATGAAAAAEFRARHERWLAQARESLGDDRAGAAWTEGRGLPHELAIEEARSEAGPGPPESPGGDQIPLSAEVWVGSQPDRRLDTVASREPTAVLLRHRHEPLDIRRACGRRWQGQRRGGLAHLAEEALEAGRREHRQHPHVR